jgi:hypothetical protein
MSVSGVSYPVLSGLLSGVKSDGVMIVAWTFLSKSTFQVPLMEYLYISQPKILRECLSNAHDPE